MARKRKKPVPSRRKYSESERAAVVSDAGTLGVCAAARKHGVSQSNVSRWLAGSRRSKPGPQGGRSRGAVRGPTKRTKGRSPKTERSAERRDEQSKEAPRPEASGGSSPKAAKPGRRTARSYTPSQVSEALEYAATHGVSAASKALGMSRFTIYDWRSKARRAASSTAPSPTSGPEPSEVEAQRDAEILGEWKKHPGLGPSQVKNQLRRRGVRVSVRTVRRVMEDAGYRPPKVKRKPHDERFEAVRPNHLWHLDFVHRYINRATTFTLILLDDCARYVVGHGVSDAERAGFVIETFEDAVRRHGKPEMVIHDKGSAFWSWRGISRFTALLTELGIDQIEAKHKEWNGKLEVFNANIAKELFDVQRFSGLSDMQAKLTSHLHWYNHGRTSHALGGLLVPADRYYGRAEEVLARIEAGGGRELGDGIGLRDRELELFKVVSRGGNPEVWLMGRRILELRE